MQTFHITSCLLLIALMSAVSCTDKSGSLAVSTSPGQDPFVSATLLLNAEDAADSFVALTLEQSGLEFSNVVDRPDLLMDATAAAAGLASGDYDNDGDIDVFLVGLEAGNRLYRNDGDFHFTDVTALAGADLGMEDAVCHAAMFADLDADGMLDLLVCTYGAGSRLFMGDGLGGFSDQTEERGAGAAGYCNAVTVLDIERDGDLDLYIGTGRAPVGINEAVLPAEFADAFITNEWGQRIMSDPRADAYYYDELNIVRLKPENDWLLINDGAGHFDNGIGQTGIDPMVWTRTALAADFNDDGWTDLYLASDMASHDGYYINQHDGTFSNQARYMLRRSPYHSRGVDVGDINGDGLLDVFAGETAAAGDSAGILQYGDPVGMRAELGGYQPQLVLRNCLYLNRGQGWMSELAEMCGVQASGWSWSSRIADLDCSGSPELFISNGSPLRFHTDLDERNKIVALRQSGTPADELQSLILEQGAAPAVDRLYTSETPLNFYSPTDNWGITGESISCGTAIQDFDGDGDLDLIINRTNDSPAVWRNDRQCGNRLTIDLRQDGLNRQAVGARLKAFVGTRVIAAEVSLARGYSSAESARVHFGTGQMTELTRLEIIWPDGALQVEQHLASGSHYEIRRRADLPQWAPAAGRGIYERHDFSWQRVEQETLQKELDAEPLLPLQRGTLGGGMGIADFDLDGQLDVYFAGAAGQQGQMYMGESGSFVSSQLMDGIIPADVEEMSVLCFDANGDERPDMLISAGGNEAGRNTLLYRNWLVLNTSAGMLAGRISTDETSSGSACSADLDRDGDLDIFIAGRQQPGSYMTAVPSELLINESGTDFSDGSPLLPGGTPVMGVLTDARFCDVDNDGWPDLLTCAEYGSVQLYHNSQGRFDDAVELTPHGMWNSLAAADVDNDGDMDIVAGNQGLNTKYQADKDHAMTLFAADFNGDGQRQLLEVRQRDESDFEVLNGGAFAGRPPAAEGAAGITTWHGLSAAAFSDLFGDPAAIAEQYNATELSSMLLVNDGSGTFTAQALPREAQYTIAFGIDTADYDNDGYIDMLMAGNFYATQPETGRWNAGYGQLLVGTGTGSFTAVEPSRSGIYVYQDSRGVQSLDTDGDGLLECLMSVAYSSPLTLKRRPEEQAGRGLLVSLVGKDGNRWGIGSRLTLELDNGTVLTRDRPGGSGYQSSSLAPVHFGIPEGSSPLKLTVHWPDGSESTVTKFSDSNLVTVLQY